MFNRWEFVVAGPPMAQIAVAEPLALPGETVISPEAWDLVSHLVEATPLVDLKDTPRKVAIIPEYYNFYRIESLLSDIGPSMPQPIYKVGFQQRHLKLLRRLIDAICVVLLLLHTNPRTLGTFLLLSNQR